MSQVTAQAHGESGSFDSHFGPIDLSPANTTAPANWGKGLMGLLLVLGIACIGATAAYGFMDGADNATHAWLSYHVGALVAIGLMLGPLGLVLMFRATQAGWAVTFRRQMENIAGLLPLAALLILPLAFSGHHVWHWMDPAARHEMAEAKLKYLAPGFFWGRVVVYVALWSVMGRRMYTLSRRQDVTGDKGLTNTAQRDSAWGLLVYGLTTAFAAFDLSMSLDYHWFSTMFGVYFFAGNTVAGVALTVLVLAMLRSAGVLKGLVTEEHFHDMGKLLLAFTVFWGYIGFSQYFLIWYANIPEETAWIVTRTNGGWEILGKTMMFGHFLLPFVILLFRKVKKTPALLSLFAIWQIAMHCVDVFWQVRPVLNLAPAGVSDPVSAGRLTVAWVDATGLLGPVFILLALVIWKARTGPLIPLKDPRLPEALNHKNYV